MTADLERTAPGDTFFYRLRYTPMRDLIRGRLTARLDIAGMCERAGLASPLSALVLSVVRRTRLTRFERADVAQELIGHLQDGLEAGASVEHLQTSFGDAHTAARLIRRAVRRRRGIVSRSVTITLRSVAALFLVTVLAYAYFAVRVYYSTPTLSHNYLKEINAPLSAIPEADRAWPLYRQAALLATAPPTGVRSKDMRPSGKHWAEASAYVAENAEVIQLYRDASRKPHLGATFGTISDPEIEFRHETDRESRIAEWRAAANPEEENPMLIGVVAPQYTVLREASDLLRLDAFAAAEAGDAARVMEDIESTLRVAEHAREIPFLISDLVAVAVMAATTNEVGTLLDEYPTLFSDQQLVTLSHRIAGLFGGGRIQVRVGRERAMFKDVLQRIYTDDGHGNGHLTAGVAMDLYSLSSDAEFSKGVRNLATPLLGAFVADREEMSRTYDRLMDAAESEAATPLWEKRPSEVEAEVWRMSHSVVEGVRYLPIVLIMPSLSRAAEMGERATQHRDAALTVIALVMHHRRTGQWPATLGELTPTLLPAVPLDRYDGTPLKYRVVDRRPVLYSIGVDRDDDGGRPPVKGDASRWQPAEALNQQQPVAPRDGIPDGDWVLWPQPE